MPIERLGVGKEQSATELADVLVEMWGLEGAIEVAETNMFQWSSLDPQRSFKSELALRILRERLGSND